MAMERIESVAALERLAAAFVELLPDTPGLMVDDGTQAPPEAIGWRRGRNFRVRLRRESAAGQASAYYRVGPAGLELMMATSRGDGRIGQPMSDDHVPDGEWGAVHVSAGDERLSAQAVLRRLGGEWR